MRLVVPLLLSLAGTALGQERHAANHEPASRMSALAETPVHRRIGVPRRTLSTRDAQPDYPAEAPAALALAKRGIVVSLEQPVAQVPMPEATKRDGRSHAASFYEVRFRTFPDPDLETGNPGFSSDIKEYTSTGPMTHCPKA